MSVWWLYGCFKKNNNLLCLQNQTQPLHADPQTGIRRHDSPWVSLTLESPHMKQCFSDDFLTHAPFGAALMWRLWQNVSYASFLIFLAEDIQLLCVHGENIERRKWSSTGESKSSFPPPAACWQCYKGKSQLRNYSSVWIYCGHYPCVQHIR